jgi:purine-binding chemotaxis protein CheW
MQNNSSDSNSLSGQVSSKANQSSGERYLCFLLGQENYAIPLLSVKEVIAPPEITPVPQTPNYFLGIMNLRGQIISVMDLRSKLGITPSSTSEKSIIICDLKPNSIGVVVDAIDSVYCPTAEEISDKPEIQSQRNTDYIDGVFRHNGKLVLLLDIVKSLSLGDHQAVARAVQAVAKAA